MLGILLETRRKMTLQTDTFNWKQEITQNDFRYFNFTFFNSAIKLFLLIICLEKTQTMSTLYFLNSEAQQKYMIKTSGSVGAPCTVF